MFKKIALAVVVSLVVLIGGLAIVVALQPDKFSVQRSATIVAPPEKIFPLINDLAAWDGWSPWIELDPNPKKSISNPSAGKGASFTWDGNDQIGAGSLTILESKPNELIELEQAFTRPLEGKARMEFVLEEAGSGTKVTWTMDGANDFLGKAMCLIMDMDATVGTSFAQGLANMKAIAEKRDAATDN